MPQSILVFAAHPDDAEFFAGGTLARMAREGARLRLAIATDGRRGSFSIDSDRLAETRQEEARRAAAVIGAEPPLFLGHPDLELDRLPPGTLREQFIRLIRELRPDVLFAPDPFVAQEIHPDHRAVAWAASDAVHFATLPLMHPEHVLAGLTPHFVAEKYFYAETPAASARIVDISQTIDLKLRALAEHRSQMEFLVEDVRRQAVVAGLDLQSVIGAALDDPMAAVEWAMRAQAAEVGARLGLAYGEAFRYVRFHPIVEDLLATRSDG